MNLFVYFSAKATSGLSNGTENSLEKRHGKLDDSEEVSLKFTDMTLNAVYGEGGKEI